MIQRSDTECERAFKSQEDMSQDDKSSMCVATLANANSIILHSYGQALGWPVGCNCCF
jgi:hypothetical protein